MPFLGMPDNPPSDDKLPEWRRQVNRFINSFLMGKTNNTSSFTLTANSATTTLTFAAGQLGQDTVITWAPTTANAAAAMANLYVSGRNVTSRTLTLTHANTATTDRTFSYVLTG
jgi:hypothetical protein